ncbi:MAG: 6-carboxytetrahydropterin synthase QueD [Candidatus Glassbacteria bacterium]|nr:6-carboxytetrahydropterin synthase QueD [Candidatus Glassbacteria bacterium]
MYRISVDGEFSSAHSLRDYPGKCARPHGHNWRVRLSVRTQDLDDRGMAVDFGNLKALLEEVLAPFDHRDLNSVPPFDTLNPTAENLARIIFEQAEARAPDGVAIDKVLVWESEKSRVEYSKK